MINFSIKSLISNIKREKNEDEIAINNSEDKANINYEPKKREANYELGMRGKPNPKGDGKKENLGGLVLSYVLWIKLFLICIFYPHVKSTQKNTPFTKSYTPFTQLTDFFIFLLLLCRCKFL